MANKKLSAVEIGARIRAGKTFVVMGERERKAALQAAKYAGVMVASRYVSGLPKLPKFAIFFLDGPK